jgi:hypothetical protein
MLKDLINFAKFRYGRVVMVPYWVGQSPSQGMLPKKTLSNPGSEYNVDGGRTFEHGVLLMGLKSLDSTVGTKPTTEAQLDSAGFNSGMVLQILRSDQIIDGLYIFL